VLIENEWVDVSTRIESNATILQGAIKQSYLPIIKLVLSKKPDVNAVDNNGCTALHVAALVGDNISTQLLIDRGARVEVYNNESDTPLHVVCRYAPTHCTEVASALLLSCPAIINSHSKDNYFTPLHTACRSGKRIMVAWLLEKKADVNAAAFDGSTPLHYAAAKGDEEIIKLLLKAGADRTKKDKGKNMAIYYTQNSVLRDLLSKK
jgi:serine/threonine-protein phosphatase 6 regulatory ankyrin repeat subunit B